MREKLLMDFGWRFALGHAYDTKKDFDNGTGYFSYMQRRDTAMVQQRKILTIAAGGNSICRTIGALNFPSTTAAATAMVIKQ